MIKVLNSQTPIFTFAGPARAVAALHSGTANPTARAAADFDVDGAMDVVAGYATSSGGVLAIDRGNPNAYAPKDVSLYRKAMLGNVPVTFLSTAASVDGHVAVSVDGASGPQLVILAPGLAGLTTSAVYPLPVRGTTIAWGNLGGGADVAVGAGGHVVLVYNALGATSQTEEIAVPYRAAALTVGDFIWDRDARTEIAVLAEDGSIHILQHGMLDRRALSAADIPGRRAAMRENRARQQNPLALGLWSEAKEVPYSGLAPSGVVSASAFSSPRLAASPTHDLMVLDAAGCQLTILDTSGTTDESNLIAINLCSGFPPIDFKLN